MSKQFYVYKLIDPRSNQPFYVGAGSGRRPTKRLEDHILEAKDPAKWTNPDKSQRIADILAEGLEPLFDYSECVDETHCANVEKDVIKHFGRMCDGGILTNRHPGGGGIKGVRHGANKNGRLPPKPVYQFDLSGKLLKCFPAVTQAADAMGVSHTAILNAISGRHNTKTVAGYQWSYNDQQIQPVTKAKRTKRTVYEQYDMQDTLIAVYQSGQEMRQATGVEPSSVIKFLKGKIRHAGGFRWKTHKEGE